MSQTRVLISPKPRARLPQQPTLLPSLQATTLAPAVAVPVKPSYFDQPRQKRYFPEETLQSGQLQTLTFVPGTPLKPQLFAQEYVRKVPRQVYYPNLLGNTLSSQLYFLNDSGFMLTARVVPRVQVLTNLNMTTLAPVASQAPFIPVMLDQARPRRLVGEETLQSGLLQTLTATTQAPLVPIFLDSPKAIRIPIRDTMQSGLLQTLNAQVPFVYQAFANPQTRSLTRIHTPIGMDLSAMATAPLPDRITIDVNSSFIPIKDPDDNLYLTFDWSAVLDGVTLVSATHTASTGITASNELVQSGAGTSQVDISGGSHGGLYILTLTGTLSDSSIVMRIWPVRGFNS